MTSPFDTRLDPAFLGPPIAHRGLHDKAARVIENSRSAVRAAVAAGYGVEIDIQPSADGEAMVFHDYDLKRLTGIEGQISDRPAGELQALTLTGGAEGPPTLAEVLEIVDGRTPLLVEIKDQADTIGVGKVEARVAELLSGYDGPVAVMSFNPHSMIWFYDHAPACARGLVSCAFDDEESAHLAPDIRAALAELKFFGAAHGDFVSYDHHAFPNTACQMLRGEGVPILCWTVRSEAEEAEARLHADNITFERYRAKVE
jgi:glycerophosphoryl diester phosphodiesterase